MKPVDLIIAEFIENKKQQILDKMEHELWHSWGKKILSRHLNKNDF